MFDSKLSKIFIFNPAKICLLRFLKQQINNGWQNLEFEHCKNPLQYLESMQLVGHP
jgi:hypothetical protein